MFLQLPAFQADSRRFEFRGLITQIILWRWKRTAVRSFALPALCQVFPRLFPPCFGASHLVSASPSLAGRHIADSCSLSTKMMVHLAWDASTYFGAAMVKHLASARSVGLEPFHILDWSCLPPFPVHYPGGIRYRTVFHCYTCIVLKGPAR
jgi:hypothetical protein